MRTADPDLHETFAPLREVEPTPAEIARVLALADELRSPRSLAAPRRRAGRAVALVAATAAVIGAIAALPGGESSRRPQDAHGILQAAAAVAAEQPAPAAYRYTRAFERFVYGVNAPDGQHGRVTEQQTSENWTSDGWRGRTAAVRGTAAWATRRPRALLAAAGDVGAVVKAYDGDYRYGDGPLARVPFAAIPRDAAAAGAAARGRDPRRALAARPQRASALGARRRRLRGRPQRCPAAGHGQPRRRPAPGAVRAARVASGGPIAGRGHRRDRAQGRRRGAAPARLRR